MTTKRYIRPMLILMTISIATYIYLLWTADRTAKQQLTVSLTHHSKTIVVDARGNLTYRLTKMNRLVDQLRESTVNQRKMRSSTAYSRDKHRDVDEIRITDDSYVDQLVKYPYITTVVLPWQPASAGVVNWTSQNDYSNLLIQDYYPWSGTRPFCRWIPHNPKLPQLYVHVFSQIPCNDDISKTTQPQSVNFGHMKANSGTSFSHSFYHDPPSSLVHLHLLTHETLITDEGHITSGNVRLMSDYCLRNHDPINSSELSETAPFYDELFAMKHPPGGAVYHGIAEEIPRVAPFVQFLKRHPQIKIHASNKDHTVNFFRVLGLSSSRIVTGTVHAGTVYVPRLASCMMPRLTETQILSQLCRQYIRSNFPAQPRNRLILIRRKGKVRRFYNQRKIEAIVESAAKDFGLEYTAFSDSPVPSFNSTMRIFHSAVMVVATPGAGLSNLIFSEPGTYVIEGVIEGPIAPLCFLQLAHVLGHHYHAIPSVRIFASGLVQVDGRSLNYVVRQYLKTMQPRSLSKDFAHR